MADVYEDLVSGNAVVLPVVTEDTLYTPAITGFGTVATQGIYWRRVGSKLHVSGRFVSGTPTATTASIPFPPGLTAAVQGYTNLYMVGKWSDSNSNGSQVKQGVLQVTNGGTAITFGVDDTTSSATAPTVQNGNNIQVVSGTTVYINGEAIIPIVEWAGSANVAYGAGISATGPSLVPGGVDSGQHSTTFTWNGSGGTTGTIAIDYSRVGKSVTLNIPRAVVISGTASTVLLANTALPVSLRPKVDTCVLVRTREANAATNIVGQLTIYSTGVIELVRLGAAWANASAGSGFEFTSASYVVA